MKKINFTGQLPKLNVKNGQMKPPTAIAKPSVLKPPPSVKK
jgi:hypothetical protein